MLVSDGIWFERSQYVVLCHTTLERCLLQQQQQALTVTVV